MISTKVGKIPIIRIYYVLQGGTMCEEVLLSMR